MSLSISRIPGVHISGRLPETPGQAVTGRYGVTVSPVRLSQGGMDSPCHLVRLSQGAVWSHRVPWTDCHRELHGVTVSPGQTVTGRYGVTVFPGQTVTGRYGVTMSTRQTVTGRYGVTVFPGQTVIVRCGITGTLVLLSQRGVDCGVTMSPGHTATGRYGV